MTINRTTHDDNQLKQAQALSPLAATPAYQEFTALIRQTFGE